jgi:hypothetical protein
MRKTGALFPIARLAERDVMHDQAERHVSVAERLVAED